MLRLLIVVVVTAVFLEQYTFAAWCPCGRSSTFDDPTSKEKTIKGQIYTEIPSTAVPISARAKSRQGKSNAVPVYSPTSPNEFSILNAVGEGAYATVYAAIFRKTREQCAVKVIDLNHALKHDGRASGSTFERLMGERNMLVDAIGLSFVIQVKFTFRDENWLYVVTQIAIGGELLNALNSLGWNTLEEELIRRILAQAIIAVLELHGRKIEHGDIKVQNFLIDADGNVVLADLGTARTWRDGAVFARKDWIDLAKVCTAFYPAPNRDQKALINVLESTADESGLLDRLKRDTIFFRTINWDGVRSKQYPPFCKKNGYKYGLPSTQIVVGTTEQNPSVLFPRGIVPTGAVENFQNFRYPVVAQ